MYPLPPDPNDEMPSKVFTNLPSSTPEECIVRVYVICGIDFQPNDTSGLVCTWLSLIMIDRIQNPTLAVDIHVMINLKFDLYLCILLIIKLIDE